MDVYIGDGGGGGGGRQDGPRERRDEPVDTSAWEGSAASRAGRPKLKLAKRSAAPAASRGGGGSSSIFGAAKPRDASAYEAKAAEREARAAADQLANLSVE